MSVHCYEDAYVDGLRDMVADLRAQLDAERDSYDTALRAAQLVGGRAINALSVEVEAHAETKRERDGLKAAAKATGWVEPEGGEVIKSRTDVLKLNNRIAALDRIVIDLHWMARRYCDGRTSYATGMFNQHTRDLLLLGLKLNPTADGTIWAHDSMGRAFDGLTPEEAAMGKAVKS